MNILWVISLNLSLFTVSVTGVSPELAPHVTFAGVLASIKSLASIYDRGRQCIAQPLLVPCESMLVPGSIIISSTMKTHLVAEKYSNVWPGYGCTTRPISGC